MKTNLFQRRSALLIVFLCLILVFIPAAAQEVSVRKPYEPITKIDLGVSDLEMKVGETYTFKVSYEPKEPAFYSLKWYISNDSVVSIDPSTFELTALAPGNARILAESFDGVSYTFCNVTVSGKVGKDAPVMKSGADMITLADADRSKITARSIVRQLEFIEKSTFSASSYDETQNRTFMVSAKVKPGTEKAERKRALELGMEKAKALQNLHFVNLQGTLEQILAFTSGNSDLIEIFELDNSYLIEPGNPEEDEGTAAKAVALEGYTENLTSVSTAHNQGYNGAGTAVAIIDTGLSSSHQEFSGRVIAQHCFSTNEKRGKRGQDRYESACRYGKAEAATAYPYTQNRASEYNHGSHVAGIAAGKNGIAPKAKIVAVQIFTDEIWWCTSADMLNGYFYRREKNKPMCLTTTAFYQNELEAYNWLLTVQKKQVKKGGAQIAAVNMSYGSGKYNSACDKKGDNKTTAEIFAKMLDAGMIPVAASGNEGFAGAVCAPSCVSKAFTVGALDENATPKIAPYSNHSKFVNILAPGTNIYSSFFTETGCTKGKNCYGYMSGTSMATPMVTGGFALLKQAFPNQTPAEYEKLLTTMTSKTAKARPSGKEWGLSNKAKTFAFKKPVMNFANINAYASRKPTAAVTKLKATISGTTVKLNANLLSSHNGIQYRIYLSSSGKLVKTVTAAKASKAQSVTGLTKGTSYYVIANPYTTYKGIKLWGPDSAKVTFKP